MKTRVRRRRSHRSAPKAPRAGRARAARPDEGGEAPVLVGGARDPAEKAAHRAARQALAGGPVRVTGAAGGAGAVQRACADCEAKDKEKPAAKREASGGGGAIAAGSKAAPAGGDASRAIRSMGPGRALDPVSRAFFEPRFGRDFSDVRIHEGAAADKAARAIDARAFAWGGDIAFAAGEREKRGVPLMAHELAHVAVEGKAGGARRAVHRATIAAVDGGGSYKAVPADHKVNVQRALDLIDKALKAQRCQDFFKDTCTAGAADTARKTFDAATIYFLSDRTSRFGLSNVRNAPADPHVVAYNRQAYDIGRWEVAATLLHEMFHTCDMSVDDLDEIVAEQATETCGFYAPWILSAVPDELDVGDTITVQGYQFGQAQDADHYVEMDGTAITSYARWEQAKGASVVTIEFRVPSSVNDNLFFAKDVDLTVVNHGHNSNVKTIDVDP
ncbi:MAG: DUF4157 domain-containing protein [Novosphingobium sp.]